MSPETRLRFPNIKIVIWFEENKSDGAAIRDWRVANDSATLLAWQADFSASGHLIQNIAFAKQLTVQCNGQLSYAA